jgi:hypothetical protein
VLIHRLPHRRSSASFRTLPHNSAAFRIIRRVYPTPSKCTVFAGTKSVSATCVYGTARISRVFARLGGHPICVKPSGPVVGARRIPNQTRRLTDSSTHLPNALRLGVFDETKLTLTNKISPLANIRHVINSSLTSKTTHYERQHSDIT